ncbi:NADAR family protein [Enterovibrio sp. ZSDZ35]|uniref:NADAR family protein n=1 Tax=Enterovibrio qingdaonensis TaxID=2899818 RepID=A0ABT5QGN1_9GAMM|nr:NADAR family protein [Enterovibrio sp. ZSDZ35]MDD1780129.1 NADAR family protein [Enterovibrio sp. ZSDZ35]
MIKRTIHFYEPNEPFGFLSNFFIAPLVIDGETWLTSEHYYQAQKFCSPTLQARIRHAPTPDEAFKLSRDFMQHMDSHWIDIRCDVMRYVVEQKFQQHDVLRSSLISTDDALLVEHSKYDAFWGDGENGEGVNQLGQILMDVRDILLERNLSAF